MPILYSAIAKDQIIVSDFATCDGNFREITNEVIAKIPSEDDKMTYYHGPYLINYKVEDGVLYLCITDKFCQRSRAFLFLNEIQRNYKSDEKKNLTEVLSTEMYRYSEDYNNIVIREGELDVLNEIGVESSETILGEKVILVNNPEEISYGTVTYVGKTPEKISISMSGTINNDTEESKDIIKNVDEEKTVKTAKKTDKKIKPKRNDSNEKDPDPDTTETEKKIKKKPKKKDATKGDEADEKVVKPKKPKAKKAEKTADEENKEIKDVKEERLKEVNGRIEPKPSENKNVSEPKTTLKKKELEVKSDVTEVTTDEKPKKIVIDSKESKVPTFGPLIINSIKPKSITANVEESPASIDEPEIKINLTEKKSEGNDKYVKNTTVIERLDEEFSNSVAREDIILEKDNLKEIDTEVPEEKLANEDDDLENISKQIEDVSGGEDEETIEASPRIERPSENREDSEEIEENTSGLEIINEINHNQYVPSLRQLASTNNNQTPNTAIEIDDSSSAIESEEKDEEEIITTEDSTRTKEVKESPVIDRTEKEQISEEKWKQYINNLEIEPISKEPNNIIESNDEVLEKIETVQDTVSIETEAQDKADESVIEELDTNKNTKEKLPIKEQATVPTYHEINNISPSIQYYIPQEVSYTPNGTAKVEKQEKSKDRLKMKRIGAIASVLMLIISALYMFGPMSSLVILGVASVSFKRYLTDGFKSD